MLPVGAGGRGSGRLFPLLALLIVFAAACGGGSAEGGAVTLTVSAASSLRYAFKELGEAFREEKGVPVTFNFASTGKLAQQIEQGAPVDVFAAANISYLDDLLEKGLIVPDTRALYARGALVLWAGEDSPARVERIEDLLMPEVGRVAIANPAHAAYGVAAREALRSAGIWRDVQPGLVLGENVGQALQYAQTGNVDVAIVALSLAVVVEGGRYAVLPRDLHSPIHQALGVVSSTPHERQARAFAAFVKGPTGRPVLRRHGLVAPGGEPQP